MKRIFGMLPLLLFVFVIDRLMFLPGRMNGEWHYEKGTYLGDSIAFDSNIEILSNVEIEIQKNQKFDNFYLLGCYFGTLYLLNKTTLEYTVYERYESENEF